MSLKSRRYQEPITGSIGISRQKREEVVGLIGKIALESGILETYS